MRSPVAQKQLTAILALLKKAGTSLPLEAIGNQMADGLSKRTLLRRLDVLIDNHQVVKVGAGKNIKYELSNTSPTISSSGQIKFTQAAQKVLDKVKQPLNKRKPVGYNRHFLDTYTPNKTQYLTQPEINKLTQIGQLSKTNVMSGTYGKALLSRVLIDLSWNSSRLEGNTYSLLDTKRLIEQGEAAKNKTPLETQMILNHKEAIEFLTQYPQDIEINRFTLLNLHALLANNLLADVSGVGRLRNMAVGILHSVYEPLAIPQSVSEIFDLILAKAHQIKNPFEQSFFLMVHLPYLQPFDDVNKRVSRLSANIPLIKNNLSPLSFIEVENDTYIHGILGIYELNKIALFKEIYLWAYERSCSRYASVRQLIGEPSAFKIKYHTQIRTLISHIVTQTLNPKQALEQIHKTAHTLPKEDQPRFIETIETELLALHEGNFARYQVRPLQFKAWQEVWK